MSAWDTSIKGTKKNKRNWGLKSAFKLVSALLPFKNLDPDQTINAVR